MLYLHSTDVHFGAALTSLEALEALPPPVARGPRHRPVPHAELVSTILAVAKMRHLEPAKTALALNRTGAVLYGCISFAPTPPPSVLLDGVISTTDTGQDARVLGFRSSTDSTFALHGVAGRHVFVCDNLALSGETFAFHRKSTTRLDVEAMVTAGFDRWQTALDALDAQLDREAATRLGPLEAEALTFRLGTQGALPWRVLPQVWDWWQGHVPEDAPDCRPRTLWGWHNCATRVSRTLAPIPSFRASTAIGRLIAHELESRHDDTHPLVLPAQ